MKWFLIHNMVSNYNFIRFLLEDGILDLLNDLSSVSIGAAVLRGECPRQSICANCPAVRSHVHTLTRLWGHSLEAGGQSREESRCINLGVKFDSVMLRKGTGEDVRQRKLMVSPFKDMFNIP